MFPKKSVTPVRLPARIVVLVSACVSVAHSKIMPKVRNFIVFSCTIALAWQAFAGPVAGAQDYRGEAVPVIERTDAVEFLRLNFLTFAFGREGPMDAPLRTPPVAGREYLVEVD